MNENHLGECLLHIVLAVDPVSNVLVGNLVHYVEFLLRSNEDGKCNIRLLILKTFLTTAKMEALETLKASADANGITLVIEPYLSSATGKKAHDRHIR